MRARRRRFTSEIAGYRVKVSYDADTFENGEVYIERLKHRVYGDTWQDAIRRARKVIKESEPPASALALGDL